MLLSEIRSLFILLMYSKQASSSFDLTHPWHWTQQFRKSFPMAHTKFFLSPWLLPCSSLLVKQFRNTIQCQSLMGGCVQVLQLVPVTVYCRLVRDPLPLCGWEQIQWNWNREPKVTRYNQQVTLTFFYFSCSCLLMKKHVYIWTKGEVV